MLKFSDTKEEERLEELHKREAEELAQVLAAKYGFQYIDLSKFTINTDALRIIPETEARAAQVAAFRVSGKHLHLVILAPKNPKTEAILEELRGKNYLLDLYIGSENSLARAWGRYAEVGQSAKTEAGVIDITNADIESLMAQIHNLDELNACLTNEAGTALTAGGISSLLEIILAGAIITEASDIHVEPQIEQVRLRYRLDGVLQDIAFFNHRLYRQLLSRVKLISGLKLNIQASAQDGRLSIRVRSTEIEIRTSILPGAYGESIVLRVLNPETITYTFETLGMEPSLLKIVEREITKPNGMVLLTGPTGSGKTTTLYAFLRRVSTTENKIITIEDPIEYHLRGINQTQVNPGKNYTFLSGLRSALRQDPDIIMIGEIRDQETAKIAINSSLTGHLVFSTLHTNNAAGTIPRLIDFGISPKVIDAALNIVMAQRLARKLCSTCKETAAPTAEEKRLLEAVAVSIKTKRPDLTVPAVTTIWRAKADGCPACHHTGYRGRQGLFEAILIDQAVTAIVESNPGEREIKLAAKPQGILDMRQDGVLKVLQGTTDLAELGRVVDLTEEII